MCYSAQVQADYKKYVVMFGATMSIRDFYEIFYRRGLDPRIKIPKAVEASFRDPQSDDERAIEALIDAFPRWPVQIPPPVATPNSPRQGRWNYAGSVLMARRLAASFRR